MSKEKERKFKKDEFYGWRAGEAWAHDYVRTCQVAVENEEVFSVFKSTPAFQTILEHVPVQLGQSYITNVANNNPKLLKNLQQFADGNDSVGTPLVHKIDNNFNVVMSPTTARYIKVLSDLRTAFGSLQGYNIVEIGGGYGGLCKVISLEEDFANYYDVDLDEPLALAAKYASTTGINNFNPVKIEDLEKLENVEIDLVISNYAFSECNYETQDVYIDKILSKAKRGYLTHNTAPERQSRTESKICEYENFKIFGEDLCRKKHKIYTWGGE